MKEKPLLITLAILQFSHITDFMLLMPLGPQLMRAFGILPNQFALLVSAYTFSAGIFGFIGAFFIDRYDRRSALIFITAGFALGSLACGFSNSYSGLLFTRALTGAFGGVLGALIFSIIGDVIPNERRASAMGLVMTSFSIASVLGVPLGLYLATASNWQFPFKIIGLLALITLVLIIKYIPSLKEHIQKEADFIKKNPMYIIRQVFFKKNQRDAILFGVIIMFSHFTIVPFISPYMVANVGFTEKQLTLIYLIGGGLTIFSAPLIGRLSDKYGRRKIFNFTVIMASIPVLLITNLGEVNIAIALVVTSLFFIFGAGRMIPSTAMLTSAVRPENRGSFMSFNSSCRQLTNGFAAYIAGLIISKSDSGLLENYEIVGYIAVVAGLVSILFSKRIVVVDDAEFQN